MATKDKVQKKAKLRHAEYYDFQGIQDRLYASSQQGRVFKNLVEIIALPENIRLAYRNIKANHGSKTAGTDGRNWAGTNHRAYCAWKFRKAVTRRRRGRSESQLYSTG